MANTKSSGGQSAAQKDKVAQATLKMWKKIGEAFRDWSKEVGAREVGNQVVDQFNEALDSVRKSASKVGVDLRARGKRKKKKKKKSSGAKSSKKKSGTKSKKRKSGGKRRKKKGGKSKSKSKSKKNK